METPAPYGPPSESSLSDSLSSIRPARADDVWLVPVTDELTKVLSDDWSEPVRIRIVDGEFVFRRMRHPTPGDPVDPIYEIWLDT